MSPRSSDLVGEMQSLAAAIQLNPASLSPFPWVPLRDPLSEREQRLLPVSGPPVQCIFSLEVLPSVPAAAALHRRHCFFKMWWLRSAWRLLQLRRLVDLHVFKWEVVWFRVEQQRQQEEMERRVEDAQAELVFQARRQLNDRKGPHWGLGPPPGPRLCDPWVVWQQRRRRLLGKEVRALLRERARGVASVVVVAFVAAAARRAAAHLGRQRGGRLGGTSRGGEERSSSLAHSGSDVSAATTPHVARSASAVCEGDGNRSWTGQSNNTKPVLAHTQLVARSRAARTPSPGTTPPGTHASTHAGNANSSGGGSGSSNGNGGSGSSSSGSSGRWQRRNRRSGKRKAKAKLAAELSAAISRDGDGAAGGKGTSERSKSRGKGKGKDKGKAAEVPRQGSSEAARWADALEAGDYSCTGPEEEEEEDLAERFMRSLLEDAFWGD